MGAAETAVSMETDDSLQTSGSFLGGGESRSSALTYRADGDTESSELAAESSEVGSDRVSCEGAHHFSLSPGSNGGGGEGLRDMSVEDEQGERLGTPSSAQTRTPRGRAKYRGVRARSGKFIAEIKDTQNNVRIWLGTFDTERSAAVAYDRAARTLRGENARTNFTLPGGKTQSSSANFPAIAPRTEQAMGGAFPSSMGGVMPGQRRRRSKVRGEWIAARARAEAGGAEPSQAAENVQATRPSFREVVHGIPAVPVFQQHNVIGMPAALVLPTFVPPALHREAPHRSIPGLHVGLPVNSAPMCASIGGQGTGMRLVLPPGKLVVASGGELEQKRAFFEESQGTGQVLALEDIQNTAFPQQKPINHSRRSRHGEAVLPLSVIRANNAQLALSRAAMVCHTVPDGASVAEMEGCNVFLQSGEGNALQQAGPLRNDLAGPANEVDAREGLSGIGEGGRDVISAPSGSGAVLGGSHDSSDVSKKSLSSVESGGHRGWGWRGNPFNFSEKPSLLDRIAEFTVENLQSSHWCVTSGGPAEDDEELWRDEGSGSGIAAFANLPCKFVNFESLGGLWGAHASQPPPPGPAAIGCSSTADPRSNLSFADARTQLHQEVVDAVEAQEGGYGLPPPQMQEQEFPVILDVGGGEGYGGQMSVQSPLPKNDTYPPHNWSQASSGFRSEAELVGESQLLSRQGQRLDRDGPTDGPADQHVQSLVLPGMHTGYGDGSFGGLGIGSSGGHAMEDGAVRMRSERQTGGVDGSSRCASGSFLSHYQEDRQNMHLADMEGETALSRSFSEPAYSSWNGDVAVDPIRALDALSEMHWTSTAPPPPLTDTHSLPQQHNLPPAPYPPAFHVGGQPSLTGSPAEGMSHHQSAGETSSMFELAGGCVGGDGDPFALNLPSPPVEEIFPDQEGSVWQLWGLPPINGQLSEVGVGTSSR